ncbi:ribosome hibernation-promoting factor, HPF/YfiA family [Tengunoibacter tsumagoiensis]|uniref:Ribosomal subunit interface protein n=1 Tax=Tengunoibacter tsumagoiensis TaxID=2014871 RepID=A0A402A2A2_9CHLR|nr:ribosome-associated translation inhibitor RaiA [Tengunoibacter tsumagoiensis]GCE13186.1 ribosomal subunit interface protein [Tengunoibacter tsumagoiensis]
MQVIIKSRQMHVSDNLRSKIEHKIQRLTRFVEDTARIEVTVTEEQTRSADDRFTVQLALSTNSHPIHSEVSAQSASAALDMALDKVVTQLGRQKDRATTIRRHHTPGVKVLALSRSGEISSLEEEESLEAAAAHPPVGDESNEAIWSQVLEIRRLPTTPMSDQEVIEHMEKDGVAFYPFFNGETNSVNVMYKLEQGGYGLLVPAVG